MRRPFPRYPNPNRDPIIGHVLPFSRPPEEVGIRQRRISGLFSVCQKALFWVGFLCALLFWQTPLQAGTTPPQEWDSFIALALSADTPQAFAEVETRLKQIRQSGKDWDPDNVRLIWSLARLVTFYRAQPDLAKAETYQIQVLKLLETRFGLSSLQLVIPLGDWAAIQLAQGRLAESRQSLERALTIVEETVGTTHLLAVRPLEQLAAIFLAQNNPSEASRLHQRIADIQGQALMMETPGDAIVLAREAKRHLQEGDETLAASLFQQSKETLMESSGPYHSARVDVLTHLAQIVHDEGDYAQEVELLKSALAISENMRGTNHPDLLPLLKKLAIGYQEMGKPSQSRPIVARLLSLVGEMYGTDHKKMAETLLAMADNLRLEKQPDPAVDYYNRAMAIFRHQDAAPELVRALMGLARSQRMQGKTAAAIHNHGEALEILAKTSAENHPDLLAARRYLAELVAEQAAKQQATPTRLPSLEQQWQTLQGRVLTLGGIREVVKKPVIPIPFVQQPLKNGGYPVPLVP